MLVALVVSTTLIAESAPTTITVNELTPETMRNLLVFRALRSGMDVGTVAPTATGAHSVYLRMYTTSAIT